MEGNVLVGALKQVRSIDHEEYNIRDFFLDNITDDKNAIKFLKQLEQCFVKGEKTETTTQLRELTTMKYNGQGNIREYILNMSHVISKLKPLKLGISDDLLVYLALMCLSP